MCTIHLLIVREHNQITLNTFCQKRWRKWCYFGEKMGLKTWSKVKSHHTDKAIAPLTVIEWIQMGLVWSLPIFLPSVLCASLNNMLSVRFIAFTCFSLVLVSDEKAISHFLHLLHKAVIQSWKTKLFGFIEVSKAQSLYRCGCSCIISL